MSHPLDPTRSRGVVLAALALFLLVSFGGAPAAGQGGRTPAPAEAEAAAPDLAEEVARLNRTLLRIADLMERQVEGQRLDLSMRRLAVESDRVAELEDELRSAEATKSGLEDQRAAIEGRLSMLASEVETMPADTPASTFQDLERMTAEAQRMLERFGVQIEDQERRILEIQNELSRRRADLQALQDRLDRELEGM